MQALWVFESIFRLQKFDALVQPFVPLALILRTYHFLQRFIKKRYECNVHPRRQYRLKRVSYREYNSGERSTLDSANLNRRTKLSYSDDGRVCHHVLLKSCKTTW